MQIYGVWECIQSCSTRNLLAQRTSFRRFYPLLLNRNLIYTGVINFRTNFEELMQIYV